MMTSTDAYVADKFLKERLVRIRKSKGLTQQQLANISGLSTKTISNIENSERSYTMRSLIQYTNALGYQIDIEKSPFDSERIVCVNAIEGDSNDCSR